MLYFNTIGEAWISLLKNVDTCGVFCGTKLKELRHISVGIKTVSDNDNIILMYGNQENIKNMKLVFHTDQENIFHHSYASTIKGPLGMTDLSDVCDILSEDSESKRGVITFNGQNGKVPCIVAINFLLRDGKIETSYFARAQDVYAKFYADLLAVKDFTESVAKRLNVLCGDFICHIVSLHIYEKDFEVVKQLLNNFDGHK